MTQMERFGLTAQFAAYAAEHPEWQTGRILSQEKDVYRLVCEQGEQSAVVSGKFRYGAKNVSDYPAVGDFVLCLPDAGGGQAVIHAVLPRKSVFLRKAAGTAKREQVVAANVDILFLCMSLNQDFNLRRLERYLAIAWESGATPVVLLTKADLCEQADELCAQAEGVAVGAQVLVTSSLSEDGFDAIQPYLKPQQTIALIGSSGVGKSTLINRLIGEERLTTNGLRYDDKGRHTTTHRELLLLPQGGIVMDTPGMRELGIWDASDGVERTFSEIEALAASCRFHDCTHTREPGCAVQAALKDGTLSAERLQSYQKLKAESAFCENSEDYLAAKTQKFKTIAKMNKSSKKR